MDSGFTGGGWQDQVGGLLPGIKVGRSRAQLPLKVEVEEVTVPEGFVQTLNDHLLLVYTGKTRLARNLLQVSPSPGGGREAEAQQGPALHCPLLPHLQDVLRSWYARLPAVVQNAHSLVRHTEECMKAFHQGEMLLPRGRAPGVRVLSLMGLRPGAFSGWHRPQVLGPRGQKPCLWK